MTNDILEAALEQLIVQNKKLLNENLNVRCEAAYNKGKADEMWKYIKEINDKKAGE